MKNNYTIVKQVLAIALFLTIISSCKKDANIDNIPKQGDQYFIDQKVASEMAIQFSNQLLSEDNKIMSNSPGAKNANAKGKEIANTTPVKGSNGSNAYYIINYKGGGFSIISADKRTLSIMAFSESGEFKTDIVPEGLGSWLYYAKTVVDSVRVNNIKYTGQDTISRNLFLEAHTSNTVTPMSVDPEDPDECFDSTEVVGPLLTTKWGQGAGYNDNCPIKACGPNGHAYTGCTTTAIAQIVKYHGFPNTYNYNLMADNYPTSETARLMGNIFNMTIESHDCDGFASTMDKTVSTLKSLGYTSSTKIGYSGSGNYDVVVNEIRAGRPVIFSGGQKGSWFIFPIYKDGHQWVADGFRRYWICGNGYLSFHMNWGWTGTYDGWYGFVGFNPGGFDFNYKSNVIVNIKP